jgi:hypothetical protein
MANDDNGNRNRCEDGVGKGEISEEGVMTRRQDRLEEMVKGEGERGKGKEGGGGCWVSGLNSNVSGRWKE